MCICPLQVNANSVIHALVYHSFGINRTTYGQQVWQRLLGVTLFPYQPVD